MFGNNKAEGNVVLLLHCYHVMKRHDGGALIDSHIHNFDNKWRPVSRTGVFTLVKTAGWDNECPCGEQNTDSSVVHLM
jgi:hypothetical protein